MREFSFILGNEPGRLAEVAQELGEHQVNLEGIAALTVLDEAVAAMVPDNADQARKVFRKLGVDFDEREAILMPMPHQPGQLATLMGRLADEGINVLSCYWSVEKNHIVFTVDQIERARSVLRIV